jgi:ComG operon protein 7
MRNCQKGFTYPLTLSILFSMCLFLTMSAELLLTERKIAVEVAAIQQQDYYFIAALKKTEQDFQSKNMTYSGLYFFENATVSFTTASSGVPQQQKVTFTVKLNNRPTVEGYGFYDINQKKMVKWMKKN